MSNLQSAHSQFWYAVHCKPHREWQAAAALENLLGLTVYLPKVRRHFRGHVQLVPLFPRYLFVRADLQTIGLSAINAVPGVTRLVIFGDTAQPIPKTVMAAIRELVDDLDAVGGLPEHSFHSGDTVRLKEGPLSWLEAIFLESMSSSGRVRILVDFLGRLREAEVDVDRLELVRAERRPQQERRTRGKGRRINTTVEGV